jgi:hypothetical protein
MNEQPRIDTIGYGQVFFKSKDCPEYKYYGKCGTSIIIEVMIENNSHEYKCRHYLVDLVIEDEEKRERPEFW